MALVLAMLATAACGGPKASTTFGGKAVPVNVSFGKPSKEDPRAPTAPFVLGPVLGGVGVVPVEVPRPRGGPRVEAPLPPPPPPPVTCPPPDIVKPALDEAFRYLGGPPPQKTLSYRIEGKVGGQEVNGVFDREVANVSKEGNGDIRFSVRSDVLGVETTQSFVSTPQRGSVPGSVGLAGVFAEGRGIDARPTFSSPKPLTILPLDVVAGATFNDVAFDPITQTTYRVAGTVVGKDKVWGCGENMDAWQVKITQEVITPFQNITSEITDWIATQYGGLILQEAASWTGTAGTDLQPVSGQYTLTINEVPSP